jgi:dienelactone hydrolase
MTISSCCVKGFEWEGTPKGHTSTLSNNNTYITGTNPTTAILIIADLFGWELPNIRLLADHYAQEANATVYIPDFFHNDALPLSILQTDRWQDVDLPGLLARNSRQIREPEIFDFARTLRSQYEKVGAIGFCYGGWAAFRLGASEHTSPLVDFIIAAHPSLLTKEDIDGLAVPVQILAPELDVAFTPELKSYALEKLCTKGVRFEYIHFPGMEHGSLVRGDEKRVGEREAMVRAKDVAVSWIKSFAS